MSYCVHGFNARAITLTILISSQVLSTSPWRRLHSYSSVLHHCCHPKHSPILLRASEMAVFQVRHSTISRGRDNLETPPGPVLFESILANLERPCTKIAPLHRRRLRLYSITGPVEDKGRLRILRWSPTHQLTKLQSPIITCAQGHKRCQLRSIVQTSSETSDHCHSKSRHNIGIRITSLHPRQKLLLTGSKKCYRTADIKKTRTEQMLPTGLTLL